MPVRFIHAPWNQGRRGPGSPSSASNAGSVSPRTEPVGTASPVTPDRLQGVVEALRARGLTPHPGDTIDDGDFLVALGKLAGSGAIRSSPTPEESVTPSKYLGLAEGQFPPRPSRSILRPDQAREWFGSYSQMVADVAAMGGGHIRRVKLSDLYWGSLFPLFPLEPDSFQDGDRIPRPSRILDRLRAGNYQVLAEFSAMLTACLAYGVKLCVTPFSAGGGASLNVQSNSDRYFADSGLTEQEIMRAAPCHVLGGMVLSSLGWDDFYWDHGNPTEDERTFQKFVMHLWPTNRLVAGGDYTSAYMRECARRKCLALSAFSYGIGEYLAVFDSVLRQTLFRDGHGINEVIEYVELGNELDLFFRRKNTVSQACVDAFGEAARGAIENYGSLEAGRYMGLIAGPIAFHVPSMRFKAAELASWDPTLSSNNCEWSENFDGVCDWLYNTISLGVKAEASYWTALQYQFLEGSTFPPREDDDLLEEAEEDWLATAEEAEFYWPPRVSDRSEALQMRASDLVHAVGFHWYHGYNRDGLGRVAVPAYQDAVRQAYEVQVFTERVTSPLRSAGYHVSLTVGEIGFSGVDPLPDGGPPSSSQVSAGWDYYYSGTTMEFQAAMLVRQMAVFRGLGVDVASWFCFMLQPKVERDSTFSRWDKVGSSGTRNEIYQTGAFTQDRDAWPRPVWYAYRRLAWLMSEATSGVSLLHNELGLCVVQFHFGGGLASAPDGSPLERNWKRGYLMWLDQYCGDPCLHPDAETRRSSDQAVVAFSDEQEGGYEILNVVPRVPDGLRRGTDARGYAAAPPIWSWGKSDAALVQTTYGFLGTNTFIVSLRKADPQDAPLPLFILTNAVFVDAE